jgi:hypothetical protein
MLPSTILAFLFLALLAIAVAAEPIPAKYRDDWCPLAPPDGYTAAFKRSPCGKPELAVRGGRVTTASGTCMVTGGRDLDGVWSADLDCVGRPARLQFLLKKGERLLVLALPEPEPTPTVDLSLLQQLIEQAFRQLEATNGIGSAIDPVFAEPLPEIAPLGPNGPIGRRIEESFEIINRFR